MQRLFTQHIIIVFIALVVLSTSISAQNNNIAWSRDSGSAGLLSWVYLEKDQQASAIKFPNADSYIEFDDLAYDFSQGFSVVFRLKISPDRNIDRCILSLGQRGTSDYLSVTATKYGYIETVCGVNTPVVCGAIDDNQWHDVAITWNCKEIKYYIDNIDGYVNGGGPCYTFVDIPGGVQHVSSRMTPAVDKLYVGGGIQEVSSLGGHLSRLNIYNRELNCGELQKLRTKSQLYSRNIVFSLEKDIIDSTPIAYVPSEPLIVDPLWKSCKDGCLIFNPKQKNWWYFFMQIRATKLPDSIADHHGTKIGVSSSDDGINWTYRGTVKGFDIDSGLNTNWAPAISWDSETNKFHAFISYMKGAPTNWVPYSTLNHFVSDNLEDWTFVQNYNFTPDNIDCTFGKLPNGKWGLWFKDESSFNTGFAEGDDLNSLKYVGNIKIDGERVCLEGAEYFEWNGYYWLIGDECMHYERSFAVLRSKDGYDWTRVKNIPFKPEVYNNAHHPEVVIVNDSVAYIYYWQMVKPQDAAYYYGVTNVRQLRFVDAELEVDADMGYFQMKELSESKLWTGDNKHQRISK